MAKRPGDEVEVVLGVWVHDLTESTCARMGGIGRDFAARLEVTGVTSLRAASVEDVEGFIWSITRRGTNPAPATVHLRRTVVRTLYRTLREIDPSIDDPSRDLDLPAKTAQPVRALTDTEIQLVRTAALGRPHGATRASLAVALSEAAATTGELTTITWADIDFDAGVVELPGAGPVNARATRLSDWGHTTLRLHRHDDQRDSPVIPNRGHRSPHVAQAAMVTLLTGLIRSAGIIDPAVRPSSIRLWAAHSVLERHGIEAAALALGVDSLDVAAESLGHRWQNQ